MAIYGSAFLLPLCHIPIGFVANARHNAPDNGAIIDIDRPEIIGIDYAATDITTADIFLIIFLTGAALAAVMTLLSMLKVAQIIRNGEKAEDRRHRIIIARKPEIEPFSWMRYIVINRNDYHQCKELIISHESEHIRLCHWIDLIIAHITLIIQWYNPAAWLMIKELRNNHEYEADQAVLASGADAYSYQLLLIKKAAGTRFPSLASNLNHSNLNNRITMMYKSKSSGISHLKALALIPAGIAALALVNVPAVATAVNSASKAELPAVADKISKNQETPQNADSTKQATANGQNALVIIAESRDENTEALSDIPSENIESLTVYQHRDDDGYTLTVKLKEGIDLTDNSPSPDTQKSSADNEEVKVVAVGTKPIDKTFVTPEEMPQFPGGEKAMMEYIKNNLIYPEIAEKENLEGRVIVRFTITREGKVENPTILRGQHEALNQEALRVVSTLPDFIPGKRNGEPVKVTYCIPINFRLPKESDAAE